MSEVASLQGPLSLSLSFLPFTLLCYFTHTLTPTQLNYSIDMSWFASSAPTGPNIHPVQLNFPDQNQLFGPLVQQDTEWQCSGGIGPTETQSYYHTQKDGSLVMVQIIYSSIGYAHLTSLFEQR